MSKPLMLFAHGAGAPMTSPWMEAWDARLSEIGLVRRFDYDYTAAGCKAPDRLPKLLARHAAELETARAEHDGPVFLVGKSMGSRVGCHLSQQVDGVDGIVCFGYPLVSIRGALRDEVLVSMRTPLMLVSGDRDRLCPLDRLQEVRSRMTNDHQLHVVPGGDHSLVLRARDRKEFGITQEESDRAIVPAIRRFVTQVLAIGVLTASPFVAHAGTYTDDFEDSVYDPPWTAVEGSATEADGQLSISGMSSATHVGPIVEQLVPDAATDHLYFEATVTSNDGGSGFMFRKDSVTGERCGVYIWANGGVWATHQPGNETYMGQALVGPSAGAPSLLGAELDGSTMSLFVYGVEVWAGEHPGCDFAGDGTVGPELHVARTADWDDFSVSWYEADADGDGYCPGNFCEDPAVLPGDCDDTDANLFPTNPEICDGQDNDCDALVDDADSDTVGQPSWYVDSDGDTFGDDSTEVVSCIAPGGTISDGTDCDDTTASTFPGAAELCDGVDQDCDGAVPGELDDDGDTFAPCDGDCDDGDAAAYPAATEACNGSDDDCDGTVPADEIDGDGDGVVGCAGDCDDTEPTVYSGGPELCDGLDNDCSGAPLISETDSDADGQMICAGDCDDTEPAAFEGGVETCDSIDNDCDGAVDEDFADGDGDGVTACLGDCDDTDPAVSPLAPEVCNGIDDDCDGLVDDDDLGTLGQSAWYPDDDDDGFGELTDPVFACAQPLDYVAVSGDCDDADAAVSPARDEECTGVDDDCDGVLLEGEVDEDGDGSLVCDGDCDDTDAGVSPEATELCDGGVDEDCDGEIDEDFDEDLDGFIACGDDADCDDLDPDVFPGAPEECNGLDDDCDGAIAPQEADEDDDGLAECDGDCDDTDATIAPGAPEACDGIDNDCDGEADEGLDLDADGYLPCGDEPDCAEGDESVHPGATELCNGLDDDCDEVVPLAELDTDGDGLTECEGDCDDTNPSISPDALETCESTDDVNCDGIPGTDYEACAEELPECGCVAAQPTDRGGRQALALALMLLLVGPLLRRRRS